MNRILILEADPAQQQQLRAFVESRGHTAVAAAAADELDQAIDTGIDVILSGRDAAPGVLARHPAHPVLVVDAHPTLESAVAMIKRGACNYLGTDEEARLASAVEDALSLRARQRAGGAFPVNGKSPPMRMLADSISKAAPTHSTVLIIGESGTGKELVARALHAGSPRHQAPLISLNCATVPAELLEAELFGHEGAEGEGLLQAAAGGTLFLDEIAEMPEGAQSRLLHTLERHPDIRLITATHRDLASLVDNQRFRADLYYRLKVVSLKVPPLRDRGDDILALADEILARTADKLSRAPRRFSEKARYALRTYHWPGNVRELENSIERAVILSDGEVVDADLLAIDVQQSPEQPASAAPDQTMEDYFVSFVTAHQDQLTETELAERLGISRKSLWERRQRLNIPRKRTRKRGRRKDVS